MAWPSRLAVSDGDTVVNWSTELRTTHVERGSRAVSLHMFATYCALRSISARVSKILHVSSAELSFHLPAVGNTNLSRMRRQHTKHAHGAPSSKLRVHHPSPLLELGCHRIRPPARAPALAPGPHVTRTQATIRRASMQKKQGMKNPNSAPTVSVALSIKKSQERWQNDGRIMKRLSRPRQRRLNSASIILPFCLSVWDESYTQCRATRPRNEIPSRACPTFHEIRPSVRVPPSDRPTE